MTDLTRSDYLKSTDLKTTRRRITDTLEAEALRLLTEERDYYVSIGREDLACQVEGLEVEVEVRPRGICKQERIEELKEENRLLIVEQEEYCSELRAWMRAATEAIERITGTEWDDDPEPVTPGVLVSVAAKAGVYRERIEELRLKITKSIAEREAYRELVKELREEARQRRVKGFDELEDWERAARETVDLIESTDWPQGRISPRQLVSIARGVRQRLDLMRDELSDWGPPWGDNE